MDIDLDKLEFSDIIASSIHDIKNSMTMLLGTLESVLDECPPDGSKQYQKLLQIQYEGKRITNNFTQLMALYLSKKGEYVPNVSENNVYDFLSDYLLEHERSLSDRGIEFEIACDEDLIWFFDSDMLAGVINNVVNNAIKYTKDKLRFHAEIVEGYLCLALEDNGTGYPPFLLSSTQDGHVYSDQQHRVNHKTSNTGLGLYFSAVVAKLHKNKGRSGYITTTNEGINGGGKFSIFLP